MKTCASVLCLSILMACDLHAQSVSTTTISGSLRVNDSLQVLNNITSTGDITTAGEIVAKDTVRAQKDVLVNGNAQIGNQLQVFGNTELNALRVSGSMILQNTAPVSANPCINLLVGVPASGGGQQVLTLSPTDALGMEAMVETNPCPTPPVIPFTWQTYGNHVNTNNRWIGTIENYDFNIKTNNSFQLVCKANGDIGLGAFGGTPFNTTGKKYRLFIANSGEVSAGSQDAAGKYPFVVKPNGATNIGFSRPKAGGVAANAMLSVDGLVLAKEVKVAIANTHWADYVFSPDYFLTPLTDVEAYIRQHKHLAEVPSEAEVGEKGIDLVEMNATLLKKIEELTLYLIEQEKRLNKLEKENDTTKH